MFLVFLVFLVFMFHVFSVFLVFLVFPVFHLFRCTLSGIRAKRSLGSGVPVATDDKYGRLSNSWTSEKKKDSFYTTK